MKMNRSLLRRAFLVTLLLAGLGGIGLAPRLGALTPGPSIVRQCPGCTNALHQTTIGSGNLFGAKFWTDGRVQAPGFPDLPRLVKCPHCRHRFWLEDARKLGTVSWVETKPEWRNLQSPLDPAEEDYLAAADTPKLAREREIYARQHAWWLANDPVRMNSRKAANWTASRRRNLERLAALFSEKDDCERVWKAEIHRELGEFERCQALLRPPVGTNFSDTAALVRQLAELRRSDVQPIPPRDR